MQLLLRRRRDYTGELRSAIRHGVAVESDRDAALRALGEIDSTVDEACHAIVETRTAARHARFNGRFRAREGDLLIAEGFAAACAGTTALREWAQQLAEESAGELQRRKLNEPSRSTRLRTSAWDGVIGPDGLVAAIVGAVVLVALPGEPGRLTGFAEAMLTPAAVLVAVAAGVLSLPGRGSAASDMLAGSALRCAAAAGAVLISAPVYLAVRGVLQTLAGAILAAAAAGAAAGVVLMLCELRKMLASR